MLTCVVNRSIHWYKCTISPFHCSQGIHIVRNCRTCVFFRRGWHRWWWLYANHCPFQITLLSQLLTEPAFPSGPQPGGSLAALGMVKAGGASGADIGCIQRLRAIPCLPPDPSSNPQLCIFFPQTQLGETVVQGFRTLEIDEASPSSKSRMPCLKSAQFGWHQQQPPGLVCLRHFLFESHCHNAQGAVKRFHTRYWIITNSDQPLVAIVCLIFSWDYLVVLAL